MNVYIYQSALLCVECATERRAVFHRGFVALADKDGNSDLAPQGPFADGGGEADQPVYCDMCGLFLENPLTSEGYQYVRDQANDKTSHGSTIKGTQGICLQPTSGLLRRLCF